MIPDLNSLPEWPKSARNGVILLAISWAWLVFSIYKIYDPASAGKFLIAGVGLCYLVLCIKNWARMLALFCNLMALIYCFFFAVVFAGHDAIGLAASLVNVALFAASSYFLLAKPTARWFKQHNAHGGSDTTAQK